MKGLRQYLKEHGEHFTEELVKDIIPIRWNVSDIEDSINGEVWYNCWSATIGDMLYLVNFASKIYPVYNKRKCIKYMLSCVEDYDYRYLFDCWICESKNNRFIKDLTPYV